MLTRQLGSLERLAKLPRDQRSAASHFLIGSRARDEEAKLPPEDEEDT
jgi:hypothetical protein